MSENRDERVVVGLDGSPTAMRALQWALHYAERTGALIEAVHVWQVPTSYGAPIAVLPGQDFESRAVQALNESVDNALGTRRNLRVERIAESGYAPKVLVEHSRNADLLVVGSRGHGSLAGMMLGSVSLHCVSHAACPVVVVRPEK